MSDAAGTVCSAHGSTPTTYACGHLSSAIACGFHANDDDPAVRWPDAWCDACEARQAAAGGWTDELTEEVATVLCTLCREAARTRNERVPALARGTALRLTADEQSALIAHACLSSSARRLVVRAANLVP